MNPHFYQNLETAYASLEQSLNAAKDRLLGLLETNKEAIDAYAKESDRHIYIQDIDSVRHELVVLPIQPINMKLALHFSKNPDYHNRLPFQLGEGYLAKRGYTRVERVEPLKTESGTDLVVLTVPGTKECKGNYCREEETLRVLREHGITEQRGFHIPEHKVVGFYLDEDGRVHVNPDDDGITITEDESIGSYVVSDVVPSHFAALENRHEFFESYQAHYDALFNLFMSEDMVYRLDGHRMGLGGPFRYPYQSVMDQVQISIERMLLIKVRDNRGEIFIGDLDHIVFNSAGVHSNASVKSFLERGSLPSQESACDKND